jgi:hypothetical protein
VSDSTAEFNRELTALEGDLKRLETEYNMYFAGRLKRPPWETRARVEGTVKRLDRTHINNYGVRFRFTTLQTRLSRFLDLWDRALRAREEGRPGPLQHARQAEPPKPDRLDDGVVKVETFHDPSSEAEKVRALYDSFVKARQAAGQERVAYDKFAMLVSTQVKALKTKGGSSTDVAFRVAIKDGKVALTARALRATDE